MTRAFTKRPLKKVATALLIFLSASLLSQPSIGAPNNKQNIQLGNIAYSGNACPNGSVSASLKPNSTKLHINFSNYIVETHGRNQRSLRKTCNIVLPIIVPAGMSISLVSANYNGKVSLPAGSQARFMNSYSFSGRRGNRFRTDLIGPNNTGYSFRDPLSSLASVWSACGKNTTLRITTSTKIKTSGIAGKTLADSRQGLVTQLRYRSCQ
ncbi:MAG: DUF4360 domain-containing protein [Thiotrichaceae bacterium]